MQYFWSPWDWKLLAALIFIGACAAAIWYRRARWLPDKKLRLVFALTACALLAIPVLGSMTKRALRSTWGPQVVVHPDYFSCGWMRQAKVPWEAFSDIALERAGRLGLDTNLRFTLEYHYLNALPWTDWVKTHGRVSCGVSGLTDNPARIGFPTGANEIHEQVLAAWRASIRKR